jgi:hypothetical protein
VDALRRLQELVGPNKPIVFPNNQHAQDFKGQLERLREELPGLEKYLDGKAGVGPQGIKDLNKFLAERGFSIRLDPERSEVGVVSVLKVGGAWRTRPETTTLMVEGHDGASNEQAAVRFRRGVSFHSVEGHAATVAKIPLVDGQALYVTKVEEGSPFMRQGAALAQYCGGLQVGDSSKDYAGVIIPMASLTETGDIPGLLGVRIGDFAISQALKQTNFRLDETGAVGESAAALGASRGLDFRRPLEIDGTYATWFETSTGVVPFAAVISPKHMLAPRKEEESQQ